MSATMSRTHRGCIRESTSRPTRSRRPGGCGASSPVEPACADASVCMEGGRRGGGSIRREHRAVHVLAMPQFEDHELPQPHGVVARAGQMFAQQAVEEGLLKVAPLADAPRPEHVAEDLAQGATEPHADRYAEALLATVDDVVRQHPRGYLLQQDFAPTVAHLHRQRQPCREVDDL